MSLEDFLFKRIYVKYLHPYNKFIERHLCDCRSVLDIGCANTSPLQYFPKNHYSCGIDIFWPYLKESKSKDIHNSYIQADILKLNIKPKSFDCVLGLGILEHLDKEEGLSLIRLMESIARKKIILCTPNGFLEQKALDGNIHQIHKSAWIHNDLKPFGFTAFGFLGLKHLRTENADLKYRPRLLWAIISELTQPFVFRSPMLASQIIFVKTL